MSNPSRPAEAGPAAGDRAVAAALLAAQQSIDRIRRDQVNDYHQFTYTSSDSMIGTCRGVLHAQGLVVSVVGHELLNTDDADALLVLRSTFRLDHAPSGEHRLYTRDLPVCPDKGRPADKASLGGETTALSYFYRDLLQLPRVAAEEVDGRDDRGYRPRERPRQSQPPRIGDGDAAGLLARLEEVGATIDQVRAHLRTLKLSNGNVDAEPAAWPQGWKRLIREWLEQFPADARPAGQAAPPERAELARVPAGSPADPANTTAPPASRRPPRASPSSGRGAGVGDYARIDEGDIPF